MVELSNIKSICKRFQIDETIVSAASITSGHINDTFLVVASNKKQFVLQKLNTSVFTNYKGVIHNKTVVADHLNTIYNQAGFNYCSINFIKTITDEYYIEESNTVWMLMDYIEQSQIFDKALNSPMVFEAGKLYGDFIAQTRVLKSSEISETLPDFHSVPLRMTQFNAALKTATNSRKEEAKIWISLVESYSNAMCELWHLKTNNILPSRITHNDTKLSNILFSNTEPIRGLAVIDLDTVMPGLVHFDFGDSVRSICSNTTEDDTDIKNATINLEYYEAYCKGFAKKTKHMLTDLEIQYLPLGVQSIIFIMGLRFLTDFLNNDAYYKTNYDSHNLVRASNQFTLFNDALKHSEQIKTITHNAFT